MSIPITARAPVVFPPPSLAGRTPPVKIKIRVPTMYERDGYQAEQLRGGVKQYGTVQLREFLRAGLLILHGQEMFDQMISGLEEYWVANDANSACNSERRKLNIELIHKNQELPETQRLSLEQMQAEMDKIMPDAVIDDRKRVIMSALQTDLFSRYEPLQQVFADLAQEETRSAWLNVETYVCGWEGLQHEPDGNGKGGLLRHEAEYLRAKVGEAAFNEISQFIFAMHGLDDDDEKNLASLLENASAPIGSTVTGTTTGSPAGNSTEENSIETPVEESPPIIEPSSKSSKAAAKKTTQSASSPTAAP